MPQGALQWPADSSWLTSSPAPLVLIRYSVTGASLNATTVPPASDPDVSATITVLPVRAPDDSSYVGGQADVPAVSWNAGMATLSVDKRGSFQVLAYVDSNHNGQRDDNETGTAFPMIIVDPLFVDNSNTSAARTRMLEYVPAPPGGAAGIWSGNKDIDDTDTAGVYLAANLDLVGGGNDGRRGLERVYARWFQNATSDDTGATYDVAPYHFFLWVPVQNAAAANGSFFNTPMFLPGGTPPLLLSLPLVDPAPGAGTGGDSSAIPEALSKVRRSRTFPTEGNGFWWRPLTALPVHTRCFTLRSETRESFNAR